MTGQTVFSGFLLLLVSVLFCNILQANIIVLNGLSHNHTIDRGGTQKGVIQIRNNGQSPQPVAVYQQDFLFNHKGETFYKDAGESERSNAKWMIINPQSLMLKPMETAEIVYEISVPDSTGLIGSYWSTIIIEPVTEIDTNRKEVGMTVSTVLRYAIQIVTDINDSARASLAFLNVEFDRKDDLNLFQVDVENNGQRMLRSEMAVELFNESGESVGIFTSSTKRTYPGTSRRYTIQLPELESGNYEAILIADSGIDEVFGVQVSLVVEDD